MKIIKKFVNKVKHLLTKNKEIGMDSHTESSSTQETEEFHVLHLTVVRTEFTNKYTMGKLLIDGAYFCDTLEDTVRERGVKIPGETAIQAGKYDVILTFSSKFQRTLPLLLDVPNFDGIRIHNGSYAADSQGCILVGERYRDGMLTKSKLTISKLMDLLRIYETQSYKITIEIINHKTNE